jgi:hypothetical protein
LLLLAALQDPLNLRFLLLSDRYYIYMLTWNSLTRSRAEGDLYFPAKLNELMYEHM